MTKNAPAEVQDVQALEVDVGTVHDIEGARFGDEHVENLHVAELAVRNMDESWDVAAQVEQRMKLDGGLGGTEQRPRENGKAQVDGRGVEREDGVVEFQAQLFLGIERTRDADQLLGKLRIDPPVALFVGVGQRVARDLSANAHVVELVALGAQTDLDVAQTLAMSQLRERHAKKLREAGERFDVAVSTVAPNTLAEDVHRQMIHDLGEYELTHIHDRQSQTGGCKHPKRPRAVQVDDSTKLLFPPYNQCITRMRAQLSWDSSDIGYDIDGYAWPTKLFGSTDLAIIEGVAQF